MAARKKGVAKVAAVFPAPIPVTDYCKQQKESEILRAVMDVLCSVNQPIRIEDLVSRLRRSKETNASALEHVLSNNPGLVQVTRSEGVTTCAVLLDVELCTRMYNTKKQTCSEGAFCKDIHLCKFFIAGPGRCSKQPCKFPHDLNSSHNSAIFKRMFLDDVKPVDLYSRLQEKFERKLKLCGFYDKVGKECKGKEQCQYLHFCRFHMEGTCKYEDECKFNHDILGENCRAILVRVGIRIDQSVVEILRTVRSHLNIEVAEVEKDPTDDSTCSIDLTKKTEICSYNIRGCCHSGELCDKIHHHLPYMWLFNNDVTSSGNTWRPFNPDEQMAIEKAYCNVEKSTTDIIQDCKRFVCKQSADRDIATLMFEDMMILRRQVRRLSTRESVFEPTSTPFTTRWVWYWKEDEDTWIPYSKQQERMRQSDKDSDELEELYQYYLFGKGEAGGEAGGEAVVPFSTSIHHKYQLSFHEMKQINQVHGKKRDVRRRPERLVTIGDVDVYKKNWRSKLRSLKAMANQHMPLQKPPIVFPTSWSNCFADLDVSTDFCLVDIKQGTDEYYKISKELTVVSPKKVQDLEIQRIHNFELWEDFYKKRNKMSDEIDGKKPRELILWYGTGSHDISAICQQNFDVSKNPKTSIVCFARNVVKCMTDTPGSKAGLHKLFRVRVLINKVMEHSKYKPCARNDVCSATCDSITNPSTFTVFSKDQLYPEYLISFRY